MGWGNPAYSELCKREFDSTIEKARAEALRMLEIAGSISQLSYQPKYKLSEVKGRICTYSADFFYVLEDGDYRIEDVKDGRRISPSFPPKLAWFANKYPEYYDHFFIVRRKAGLWEMRRPKDGSWKW